MHLGMSYANVPIFPWHQQSTARDLIDQVQFFEITHEFHPLLGKVYELVDRRRTWGEDRVYYHDDAGKLCGMRRLSGPVWPTLMRSFRSRPEGRVSMWVICCNWWR
jgi:hypothetical protein